MTLNGFVMRNTFRNKRRSLLTMLSISFSLLLLTLMMSIWRTLYIDQGAALSGRRVITRDRVSLSFFLPGYYREKIRSIPGVVAVAPMTWFGGRYKDDRPENSFAQMATDPEEYLKVAADKIVPPDQGVAWQRDRAGALVDETLIKRFGWKVGDKITLEGSIFEVNPELKIRAIYHRDPPQNTLYFNAKYLEESLSWFKGQAGWYVIQVSSPDDVARVSGEIDGLFKNSPQPTKTESEKAFMLSFVAMLGNVKAFILGICGAVVFAILLVSANTIGDVGAQPHARSGCVEDIRLRAGARALAFRVRGRSSGGCRRGSGHTGGGRINPLVNPHPESDRRSGGHESHATRRGTVVARGCNSGVCQRLYSGVRRFPRKHCGRVAPHRLVTPS
jgi:putative ABC transport system permease protein